ncbi:chemotaxis protein CheW [Geobacter sulfurreducens]|jgi:purine-binding chemotaxis protein CheW|uniref:Chemotaxis protein CheW n=1 Tax=Geobacter sulfurreducens (strain ATCC 51573 / DSM 12127 / PCA) TaxID=243231 RepID=Q74FC5_GEOSL|nr:chemotaxis protein CheW [Geobacter sulfurreducens]AAR34014.1 scaffold protein CheW associated with MCPs of class 34H [Geobacter sulfurreducens PCA]UAC04746.1 chemotaxis protein CheW [Geobacter sulfurreducens]HCD96557.1 chemotaxis protein CheW [Geobacter sulfurreducens]HML80086.1 chemotaxis protein CheW [Geobacter sulfurreducens]
MAHADVTETRQYLTFTLAGEVFAVDVAKVREILEWSSITKVPQTPEFMRGVINLRGSVVPVIDLRQKFGMPETERSINTCIIVVEVETGAETLVLGMLADSVQEVFELESGNIEPAPRIGTKLDTSFLKGMGKHGDAFLIILDIDRVFGGDDLAGLAAAGEAAA